MGMKKWYEEPDLKISLIEGLSIITTSGGLSSSGGNEDAEIGGSGSPWAN